ncbi:hypothetical protein [Microbacterium indicum]|uniref:hypothetical protein n=1 Tax=Microbacterium indicum TaxID=358100 RepID=UPI0003FCAD1B|nr:hypothetical protein [Microbacterium indicum]
MDDLRALLDDARSRLDGVPQVRLGLGREASRFRRAFGGRPVIEPVAPAWHLGVLLLGSADLWAVGDVIRAAEEVRRGYTADAQRVRASMRGMAFRGGFAEGETCHIDWEPVDVDAVSGGADSGPLAWADGRLQVRWSKTGWLRPLDGYLDEQVGLATAPRAG